MERFFMQSAPILIPILQVLILLLILLAIFRRTVKEAHSNWNTLINGFNYSTKEFYELLSKELKSHDIKGIRTHNVFLPEGGIFSSNRLYLRVRWKEYQYDICAAPFGEGFFVSWWLLYKNSFGKMLVNRIPFIGRWLVSRFYRITYYKQDTGSMFMSYAQTSVLKVIDDITKEKGVRSLSEEERKPVMRDIFKR